MSIPVIIKRVQKKASFKAYLRFAKLHRAYTPEVGEKKISSKA